MAKTAKEQLLADKQPKRVVLDKDFAGVKKGQRMYVATPAIVDAFIKSIPYGETRTIPELRDALAKQNRCDASCPVSTAIFIRIASQAAIDEMDGGEPGTDTTPFWRVLTSDDKITQKLTIDPVWLDAQRGLEQVQG